VKRRPVIPGRVEDLYEDGLRFTHKYPNVTGVGCVVREVGDLIYAMVTAVEVEDTDGRTITRRRLAAVPSQHRERALELAAIRACVQAHAELDRSLADRAAS
jgi:hypothetical protein